MERSHAFETVLVLILIGLIGLMFFMITAAPQPAKGWEMQGNDSVNYMFTGSDDTLYVFQGNNITAVGKDGRVAWSLHVPDEWKVVQMLANYYPNPVAAEAAGTLYVYMSRDEQNLLPSLPDTSGMFYDFNISARVVAISPDGTYLWEHPFVARAFTSYTMTSPADYRLLTNAVIQAVNGRVLVFHDYREDVLDSTGKLLFTLDNVAGPMAVDAGGHMYGVAAGKTEIPLNNSTGLLDWDYQNQLSRDSRFIGEDFARIAHDPSYLIKTSIINAYDSDGTLLWSKDIGEKVAGTYDNFVGLQPVFRSLPLRAGDVLYVPVDDGTAAIGIDGDLLWIRHLTGTDFRPFLPLPVDDNSNVYMVGGFLTGHSYVCTISPDGTISRDAWEYDTQDGLYTEPAARSDGTVFLITNSRTFPLEAFNRSMQGGQMMINTLTAYNITSRQALWSFNAPAEDVHRIILNASNVAQASPWGEAGFLRMNTAQGSFSGQPVDAPQVFPVEDHRITINPGKNIVYLSYYSVIYERPVVFDSSRAVYVNSLYALDYNGTLLWKQPLDGFVTHAVARNDTFYYSTDAGKIGGSTVNIAAGIALAAIAYVFLRFFMLGTVARAKTRLESNRNRNDLLKFINENPGVTAVDISRGLKMNLGTIRYHLFILTANHKIVSYKDDGKFLRYFRNSGAYTPEERSWLSLMRREPIRKVIEALEHNPGQSMQELARELDMSPTAVYNHISELSTRGIVDRAQGDDRGYAYTIKAEYRPFIMKTMEKL